MLNFENVQIQLVDLPALAAEFSEPWMAQVVRYATSSVVVVDVNDAGALEAIEYIERQLEQWHTPLGRLLVGNKTDLPGGAADLAALADLYGAHYRVVGVSAVTGAGLAEFARAVFEQLDLVRVYTKAPGKRAELATPYVLKRGATVLDAALHVHKDFAEHLKFARLYRIGAEHDGLMVERRHAVEDEDILEFHI